MHHNTTYSLSLVSVLVAWISKASPYEVIGVVISGVAATAALISACVQLGKFILLLRDRGKKK